MADVLEIILLVAIAWFIIFSKNERVAGLFNRNRKIILDSCALIDGRIVEVVNSRFMADELVIPQFILNELQLLADGNDSHKRERARFGLDIAHQLQDASPTPVTIERTVFTEAKANDDKLILLAKKLNGALCTTDYNLGKVAAVEGISVLNVNELSQALRPIALPGETLKIKIIQKGSNRDQGVGYLEDGTMIVVDGAARYINKTMPVTVTRMHQTVAGKMVFGQIREDRKDTAEAAASQASQERGTRAANGAADRQADDRDRPRRKAAVNAGAGNRAGSATSGSTQSASTQGKLHGRLQRLKPRRRPVI
jgi:uncharacterized protein YacL